jgi:hypothetical protein
MALTIEREKGFEPSTSTLARRQGLCDFKSFDYLKVALVSNCEQ